MLHNTIPLAGCFFFFFFQQILDGKAVKYSLHQRTFYGSAHIDTVWLKFRGVRLALSFPTDVLFDRTHGNDNSRNMVIRFYSWPHGKPDTWKR